MANNHPEATSASHNPIFSFFMIIVFALMGMFVGNFVGVLLVLPFYGFDLTAIMAFLGDPMGDDAGRMPLLMVQSAASIFSFIVAPLLYVRFYEKGSAARYLHLPVPLWPALILTVFIAQTFMFVNTPVIEWNMNVDFPDFLGEFEAFAIEQEAYLKEVTEYVTVLIILENCSLGYSPLPSFPA